MVVWFSQASGIIIRIDSSMLLPFIYRNSRALSKLPESEQLGSIIGKRSEVFLPNILDEMLYSINAINDTKYPISVSLDSNLHFALLNQDFYNSVFCNIITESEFYTNIITNLVKITESNQAGIFTTEQDNLETEFSSFDHSLGHF